MADISLPSRSRSGIGRRRPAEIPSAEDVRQVPIVSDPGLRIPKLDSSEGIIEAGKVIADFGADIAKISDAADRARKKTAIAAATTRATSDLKSFVIDLETDTDYQSYADKFKNRAEKAFETNSWGMDPETKGVFRQQFEKFSVDQALDVRKLANKRLVDAATADLDTAVDQYAHIAAQSSNPAQRTEAMKQATDAIDSWAESGLGKKEEAGKKKRAFLGKLDETDARQLIFANPQAAERALSDPTLFPNMDEQRRIGLLDTAARRSDTQVKQRIAEADRAERKAERDLKKTQSSNEAAAIVRINRAQSEGADTPLPTLQELTDMLDRQDISDEGFRMLERRLYDTSEGKDNPAVVNDLYDRMVRQGSDIHERILQERGSGRLSGKTADQLIVTNQARIERNEKEPFRNADEKRAYDFLSTKLGADKLAFSFDDDTASRLADARREFQQRVFDQNEAPLQVADDIVGKYQRAQVPPQDVGYVNMTIQSEEDVRTAGMKLRALRDGGKITESDYKREMGVLRRHNDMIVQQIPTPKAK